MTGGFGGMLSFLVRGTEAQARDVARFVLVFVPATSLGGVESLIEHRRTVEGPHSTDARRRCCGCRSASRIRPT